MSVIKTKALCIFSNDDKVLVSEYTNPKTGEPFYRPLGGNIEFTESSKQGLKREIQEELETCVCNLELLDVIENIYYFKDKYSHEILFIYDGMFEDEKFYNLNQFEGYEKTDNRKFKVMWKPLIQFIRGDAILYPEGLLDLLQQKVFLDQNYNFSEIQETELSV
jgi:8-oxo-dGTP pyrophosphatase MutT (NUDIX family)